MSAMVIQVMDRLLAVAPVVKVTKAADYPTTEMAAEYEKASGNHKLMHLTGAFVEAEKPNVNGAFWDTADLEYGEHTIVHAPVNFLHHHRHVIGSFTDSRLIKPATPISSEAAAGAGPQRPFLHVNAVAWPEFFPHECRMVEIANDAGTLFWSMETQSRVVRCETSDDGNWKGCGAEYPFEKVFRQPLDPAVCSHVRERASQRHFVQPRFNAGAVIVPPVRPGWREARAEIVAHAEKLAGMYYAEAAAMADLPDAQVVALMEQLVRMGEPLLAS